MGPVVSESLPLIFPEGVSTETFNTQYLQKHSGSALAVLAAAKVAANVLHTPREEVENIVFGALGEGVSLDIKVWLRSFSVFFPLPKTLGTLDCATHCHFPVFDIFPTIR